MKNSKNPKVTIVIIISVFITLLVILLGIMQALGFFDRNPNGVETKINNFNHYFSSLQKDTKYDVFTALYNIIKLNSQDPPKSGAIIRDDTFNNRTSTDSNNYVVNLSTFIVDIESVKQSYYAQVAWSENSEADLGGYPILFTCPKADQLIYGTFDCKDLFSENTTAEEYDDFPIINSLPLNKAYYTNNFSTYTQYTITYRISDDGKSLTLIITDDTGNSKENALQTIRDLGYDPSSYIIEYIDNSSVTAPPPRAD